MNGQEPAAPDKSHAKTSRSLRGIGASRGIAVAPCLVLESGDQAVFRVAINPADVEKEVRRFRDAVQTARGQITTLQEMFEHGG